MAALSWALSLTVSSCDPNLNPGSGNEDKPSPAIEIPMNNIDFTKKTQFIKVVAGGEWNLGVEFGKDVEPWLSLSQMSGTGTTSGIIMTVEFNSGETDRTCVISLDVEGDRVEVKFVQTARPQSPVGGGGGGGGDTYEIQESRYDTGWLELPAIQDGDGRYFITHDMNHAGKQMRNFSIYYDPKALLSVWVAYPLNKSLHGSGGRTDRWEYDPKVPANLQPCLYKGFSKGSSGMSGIDRGHQLPSADRVASNEANYKTFYFTNMTPQGSTFNQTFWADFETRVRTWSNSLDTLYVVTGADVIGASRYALDNNGKQCLIPSGYYKVFLGYKPGKVGNSTGGYIGAAFYLDHFKTYTINQIVSSAMTIDELEEKLGFDFFANLPAKVGADIAAKVESTVDPWWANN